MAKTVGPTTVKRTAAARRAVALHRRLMRFGQAESTVAANITAHCNPGPDGAEPICFEVVVLTVHGEAAEHLSGIVAPLLIHDLPTHVWWPGDPPFADPIFDQLVEMGDRVVVDSDEF